MHFALSAYRLTLPQIHIFSTFLSTGKSGVINRGANLVFSFIFLMKRLKKTGCPHFHTTLLILLLILLFIY